MKLRKKIIFLSFVIGSIFSSITISSAYAQILTQLQSETRKITEEALPSVVTVAVKTTVEVAPSRGFKFFFFNPFNDNSKNNEEQKPEKRELRGVGSGVIIRKNKNTYYVLTNYHVVENADEINLIMHDKEQITAKLVGKEKERDVALVSFKSDKPYKVAKIGNSDDIMTGDLVLALGSPHGFTFSATLGIVSAVKRGVSEPTKLLDSDLANSRISSAVRYIQTDASINRGNSGGPLVNINGEVIGINTWIYSESGESAGLGFAIPINDAIANIDTLIKTGTVDYGWLGILYKEVAKNLMRSLTNNEEGVFVDQVAINSPADKAGIKPGDIIIQIDGQKISVGGDLQRIIFSKKSGSRVPVVVLRTGKEEKVNVIVSKRSNAINQKYWPGFQVLDLTDDIRKQFNVSAKSGVIITNINSGSSAEIAGIKSYDIIERVNNNTVKNLRDFYKEINHVDNGELLFRINRQGSVLLVGIVKK